MLSLQRVIAAYYTSWSIYGRKFEVNELPAANLTHLNYAFATVTASGAVQLTDLWADVQRPIIKNTFNNSADLLMGNLGALFELKAQQRHLKTGLSIGGWSDSAYFSAAVSTNETRATFVSSALQMLQDFGLDFIDLDWEYPVSGGPVGQLHANDDGKNLILLLQDFRLAIANLVNSGEWHGMSRPGLSLAMPCGHFLGRYDYLQELGQLINYANLMCYDFVGPWSLLADHHSNLLSRHRGNSSADAGIKELLAAGFPAQKIVLGAPIYGRAFSDVSALQQPFNGVPVGTWNDPGVLDYKAFSQQNTSIEAATNASFAVHNSTTLIGFDSTDVIHLKAQYVLNHDLGGLMFWEASADIPRIGLIPAAHAALNETLQNTMNNLCYPDSPYKNVRLLSQCNQKSLIRDDFVPFADLAPVNMTAVREASSFGAYSHQIDQFTKSLLKKK